LRYTRHNEAQSMSLFENAVRFVLQNEGGYVSDCRDYGGPTNYGISSRSNPDINLDDLSRDEAVDLYRDRYWHRWNLSLLTIQNVASKVLDLVVWMGPTHGVKVLQRALRAVGRPVKEDGVLGAETAGMANVTDERRLLPAMRSEAAGRIREILAKDKSQEKFKKGWLNRSYR